MFLDFIHSGSNIDIKMADEKTVKVDINMDDKSPSISRRNGGACSSKTKIKFGLFHLSIIALMAFWAGVIFASYAINIRGQNNGLPMPRSHDAQMIYRNDDIRHINDTDDYSTGFITRQDSKEEENDNMGSKKLILLHGNNIWTKYDKWRRYDWRKCPPKWSNCRITTNKHRLSEADAVVYNAAKMPTLDHIDKVKGDRVLKKIFLSGLTPLRTTFDPVEYNNFFDKTITYKSESTIRIPYWPNDGLLPAMYRPKPPTKKIEGEDMLDLEEDTKNYFEKFGKEQFMAYTIKNCEDKQYANLFVRKLREEGLINTFSINDTDQCKKIIAGTVKLPCTGLDSDDCVKHFEKFKFVIVPDEDLCIDYTTPDYWKAIQAWQSVPLLYGAANYSKFLIPNSYIDTVGSEDYISPSFKKAYGPSQDASSYYKTFQLWREEDRIEDFYWPCELCRELNKPTKSMEKVDMVKFWNKEENCGDKLHVHELMRLQLVRTGVISG